MKVIDKLIDKSVFFTVIFLILPIIMGFKDDSYFYRDFLLRKTMIARIKILNGDLQAKGEMDELIKEAKSCGFSIPKWVKLPEIPKDYSGKNSEGPSNKINRYNYSEEIERSGHRYGLAPDFIKAVIKVESNFEMKAISRVGAMGLMQLMPGTSRDLGVQDPFDPKANIFGGTKYLRKFIDEFGSVKKALAAYHCGPQVIRKGRNIPKETQNYVKEVLKYYYIFREQEK